MSQLTIYEDARPAAWLLRTSDQGVMARELAGIGVRFAQWSSPVAVAVDAAPEEILEAYRPYLDRLMGETGAGSADVVKLTPDHPRAAVLRETFLAEHVHTEDEIRFFVAGSGHFVLHVRGRVFDALCQAGDLISVPANTPHWFDAGAAPSFTALRVFTDSAGWVAHFSGDAISERFPRHVIPPAAVLMDIEGTTTPLAFVHEVLFPYARARLPAFCAAHADDPVLAEVRDAAPEEEPAAALERWMAADAKFTVLKTIQGMIWAEGYASGEIVGVLYPDVAPALRRWVKAGLRLFVYSSGSVAAQRLLFGHGGAGDLTGLLQGFFDTRVGEKRAAGSYATIARGANIAAGEFLFLSDVEAELDAAAEAGLGTCQLLRPADRAVASSRHRTAADFNEVARLFGLPAAA